MTDDIFLLFEDTKKTHQGHSFSNPIARITANRLEDVKRALTEAEQWQKQNHYVAGYVSYEAGWALQSKLPRAPKLPPYPLVDFYVFKEKNIFTSMVDDVELAHVHDFRSSTSYGKYAEDFEKIFALLEQGETYQVNYTQRWTFQSTVDAWATYQTLRRAQRVEYAAYLGLPDLQILSFSPELFLKKAGRKLVTKPMKGTKARGDDDEEDLRNREFLRTDAKGLAENVMIVDLLRNDLGRVAVPGSVRVPELFKIEDYETVFQMVSEIECEVDESRGFADIFANLFPCGSITGAPKLRTMEIIDSLENEPRGIYTGAIGYLEPGGDFTFNVAIRTLTKGAGPTYTFGTGGGILIDSDVDEEYAEAALKGRFLNSANRDFALFESFLYDGREIKNLAQHLARLEKSAGYFAFPFVEDEIHRRLLVLYGKGPCRAKLSLWSDGRLQVNTFAVDPIPSRREVVISTSPVNSRDPFQRHKTSRRALYDDQYKKARTLGFYEVLYLNENSQVVEASRHNLFAKIDGRWFTPPLAAGALPGVERAQALRDLDGSEKDLTLDEVKSADEILLTNSVRGRVTVTLRDGL